jgi:hypothetical protein
MSSEFRWVTRPAFAKVGKDRWVVSRAGEFKWHGVGFRIDEGWRTDLASSPKLFRWLVPRDGAHAFAAALHDVALEAGWDRDEARELMVEGLCEDRDTISVWRRLAMIVGVWAYDRWAQIQDAV